MPLFKYLGPYFTFICLFSSDSCRGPIALLKSTVYKEIKISHYRPRRAHRAPADWGFQNSSTIGTRRWKGYQPNAPATFTPHEIYPGSHFCKRLSQPLFYVLYLFLMWGAGGGPFGWGTALQAGRSRVRFMMVSLEFFIDIILPAALWPWGWLSP